MALVQTASFQVHEPARAAASNASVRPHSTAPVAVRTIDPCEDSEWDRLVASHPSSSVFHSGAWAKVLAKAYRHRPVYLHCSRFDTLAALIPLMEVRSPLTGSRGVCLPFADTCEPLIFGDTEPGLVHEAIADAARTRNWDHAEIRGGAPPKSTPANEATFFAHVLDLRDGADACNRRFSSPVRRAIRKAERSGIRIDSSSTIESMHDFYGLHARTRRRHGLPPQPFAFFQHIQREIIDRGLGFAVIAKHASNPIAAAVFFRFGDRGLYKFGASDERHQELRASNLVVWHGIQQLAGSGVASLHFGRTSPGDAGLRRFKLGWGTREEALNYHRFRPRTDHWESPRHRPHTVSAAVFSRLPLPVNQWLGAALYPHLD